MPVRLSFESLGRDGAAGIVDRALGEVVANIEDRNTPFGAKRKVAHIKIEDSADIVDDGVAQKLKVASGARLVDMGEMKPRWTLQPYCSFPELAPPKREFLFRVDKHGQPGLFQADGDTWRGPHMQRIKEWLDKAINGTGEKHLDPAVVVLA